MIVNVRTETTKEMHSFKLEIRLNIDSKFDSFVIFLSEQCLKLKHTSLPTNCNFCFQYQDAMFLFE